MCEDLVEIRGLLRYIKNRPSVTSTETARTSEDDIRFCKEYCIIFGAATQAEPMFLLAVIFIPIFKEDDILCGSNKPSKANTST